MDLGVRDRVAVVCGASRGIGFATAGILAAEGARVVVCSRHGEDIARAARQLAVHGGDVLGVTADLATDAGVGTLVQQAADFGPVDILVTNTGGPPTGNALGFEWGQWQQAVDLLLRSAVMLCRAFVPAMCDREWGRVVGITSLAVKSPVPHLVLSNSLRAGVTGYFRTLAEEVAPRGVTVNTVLPGYTETDRLKSLAAANAAREGRTVEDAYRRWLDITPAGRLGQPAEVAAMIAFLTSRHAGFVTGQAISVDGGAVHSLL